MTCQAIDRFSLGPAAMARARFTVSPLSETIGAVWSRGRTPARHVGDWYRRAACQLPPDLWLLLHVLIPSERVGGAVPDLLFPTPSTHHETLDSLIERIAGAESAAVEATTMARLAELDLRIATDPTAQAAHRFLTELSGRGQRDLAGRIAVALRAFHDTAVRCDWPRVRSVLDTDVRFRGEAGAFGGAESMLATIACDLRQAGTSHRLAISSESDSRSDRGDHHEVVLIPTAGPIWPLAEPTRTPTPSTVVLYPSRGAEQLSSAPAAADTIEALACLIGTTRAIILTTLDEADTTRGLSIRCGWSEATVSYHLGVLRRCGLVSRARRGGRVLYARTSNALALLAATCGTVDEEVPLTAC